MSTNKNEQMSKYMERTEKLFQKIQSDPDNKLWYRNSIVELNLRLVTHVLKKYKPYTDDHFQIGCMELIMAVDKYNPSIGVPFHNFACFCIERALHRQHRVQKALIENIFADNLVYLDSSTILKNGDEVDYNDLIPDRMSEKEFDEVLEEYDLSNLFEGFIIPGVNMTIGSSKGQERKVDVDLWRELEVRYILELANIESQKARINLAQISKALGLSLQNTRNKHLKAVENIKKLLKESGYNVN